jgi:hypothetical protein
MGVMPLAKIFIFVFVFQELLDNFSDPPYPSRIDDDDDDDDDDQLFIIYFSVKSFAKKKYL